MLIESLSRAGLYLGSAIVTASATTLALMLTLIGMMRRMESEFDDTTYRGIELIARLATASLMFGLLVLLAFTLPVGEFEELPAAFTVLNPPAALSFSDQIRAMQVAGPAGELIYFTEVSGEVPGFALPTPTRQVNQCFVMINAVTDIQQSIAFYAGLLECEAPSPMPARVSILSRTNGLDEEHRHDIAPIALGPGQLFELDQWVARPQDSGGAMPCGWHALSLHRDAPPPAGMGEARRSVTADLDCFDIATPDGERIEWLCPAGMA